MTYPAQPDPWGGQAPHDQSPGYPDPSYPTSGQPAYPSSGQPAYPTSTQPIGDPAAYPPYGYPVVVQHPPTNGMSIAAMVLGILGILGLCGYGLGGFIGAVGAILGHISRKQIRERGESGDGMALAGIITGWIATGLALLIVGLIIVAIVVAANAEPVE